MGHEGDDAPPRGSSDEVVLAHASRTNQIVVTSNHDMVLLSAEAGQTVLWIDPYGRQFKHHDLVVFVFERMELWEGLLAGADDPVCLHAKRSREEVIPLEEAALRAEKRIKSIRARERRRRKSRAEAQEPLDL